MPPVTHTFANQHKRAAEIKGLLSDAGYSFTSHQYAFWRAQKPGLTVILYEKGSLVIQGGEKDAATLLEKLNLNTPSAAAAPGALQYTTLGMDESGKGDYFGPLCLAAAIITPQQEAAVRKLGVTDSKKLSDSAIIAMADKLRPLVQHRLKIYLPTDYNKLYEGFGNLNELMTTQYQLLMREFTKGSFERAILDKFSQSEAQNSRIRQSAGVPMLIVEKGETNLPVAAASVLARAAFLEGMDQLRKESGIDLPKGSGPASGELFKTLRDSKSPWFDRVAKTHFLTKRE